MNLNVILTAFAALFFAELGDKTQLAVLTLTASTKQPLSVFVGASLALILVTGLGTLVGEGVARFVPTHLISKMAAALFIGIGVWMFVKG
jgi:putative Ca2+/H+ antiporter (TMEM165/GDT1 family)